MPSLEKVILYYPLGQGFGTAWLITTQRFQSLLLRELLDAEIGNQGKHYDFLGQ